MWTIERLGSYHDRSAFDCGEATLDRWLRAHASRWKRKDLTRVFVAAAGGSSAVLGYYALSNHHVEYEALPAERARGLPRIDVPAVLLGRLAVDRSAGGKGLGGYLLFDAMRRSLRIAEATGVRVFEVRALHEPARAFCLHHGLEPLEEDPDHFFVSMATIRKLGLRASGDA